MATNHVQPPVQVVTPTEALQSGMAGRKPLNATELKRLSNYVRAHQQKPTTAVQANSQTNAETIARGKPQVSAEEQAAAVATRGRASAARDTPTEKFRQLYRLLFTTDSTFLLKDIVSLTDSLKFKSKSLIDQAPSLDLNQKALRKYLVVELALSTDELAPADRGSLEGLKESLLKEFGDFIHGSIAAFDAGKQSKLSAISMREFVRAYQAIDNQAAEAQSDVLSLFRSVRARVDREDFAKEMLKMREGFVAILSRENTGGAKEVSTPRQYLILSKINQINFLIKTQHLHKQFLTCCKTANLKGLPQPSVLIEACLQAVTTLDIAAGFTAIVRTAMAVSAENRPGRNIFITNYNRQILQSNLLKDMYKNHAFRQQISDNIAKNVKAFSLLSIGAQQNAPATA